MMPVHLTVSTATTVHPTVSATTVLPHLPLPAAFAKESAILLKHVSTTVLMMLKQLCMQLT